MIMKAGIYHSSARAMNGEVEVELEVSERRIENLRVIRSHETPGSERRCMIRIIDGWIGSVLARSL